jgi:hypothetical protein
VFCNIIGIQKACQTCSESESELLCNWRSVSQSVRLGVEQLRNSWPDLGCGQDNYPFVCHGAFSLARGRVCRVTGHSPWLCQVMYTCVDFNFFYKYCVSIVFITILLLFFFFCILNTVCLFTLKACQPRFCIAYYSYCSYIAQVYDHCLDIWSVICLAATKREPSVSSVLSLALTQHCEYLHFRDLVWLVLAACIVL